MSYDLRRLFALSAAVAIVSPAAALAQSAVPSLMNAQPFAQPREQDNKPQQAPPPAIPGAQSRSSAPAPAQSLPMDMSPNDALFDAINRGDLGAAKDALNRGADLLATNILGMTPTELSIDLGRNDITFLLLSLRPSALAELPPPQRPLPPPGKGARPAVREAAAARPSRRASAAPPSVAQNAPASLAPRQFAGDGGAPVPQAGFLGFGSTTR